MSGRGKGKTDGETLGVKVTYTTTTTSGSRIIDRPGEELEEPADGPDEEDGAGVGEEGRGSIWGKLSWILVALAVLSALASGAVLYRRRNKKCRCE